MIFFEKGASLSFPESVIGFFKGDLGQPPGGFPTEISKLILKNQKPLNGRANDNMEPVNFEKEFAAFQKEFPLTDFDDFLSYKLYPKVFKEYYQHVQDYDEVTNLPTPVFLLWYEAWGRGDCGRLPKVRTSSSRWDT